MPPTVRRHGAEPAGFDELLARADIISLHCNLDAGSRGLLDRAAFAKMKRKPLLINVARGALVVEADLAEALDRGPRCAGRPSTCWPRIRRISGIIRSSGAATCC